MLYSTMYYDATPINNIVYVVGFVPVSCCIYLHRKWISINISKYWTSRRLSLYYFFKDKKYTLEALTAISEYHGVTYSSISHQPAGSSREWIACMVCQDCWT